MNSLSLFVYKGIGVHGTAMWNSAMLVSVQSCRAAISYIYIDKLCHAYVESMRAIKNFEKLLKMCLDIDLKILFSKH